MSNSQRWERKAQLRDVVDVLGGFLGNGSGTTTPTVLYYANSGWTLTKIGLADTGVYRVTLRDKFAGIPIIVPVINAVGAAPVLFQAQAGNYTTTGARYFFDIFVTDEALVAADLANTARLMFTATWSDTRQP